MAEHVLAFATVAFVGYVIAQAARIALVIRNRVVKALAWLAALYLVLNSLPILVDLRFWGRSPLLAALWLAVLLMGIGVGSMTTRWVQEPESQVKPGGLNAAPFLAALVCSFVPTAVIIAHDPGQLTFWLREYPDYWILSFALFGGAGLVAAILGVTLTSKRWVASFVGAVPIVVFFNAFVSVPTIVAYVLGGSVAALLPANRRQLMLAVPISWVMMSFHYSYVAKYMLEGFGAFFPTSVGPAFVGAIMFPVVFGSSLILRECALREAGSWRG